MIRLTYNAKLNIIEPLFHFGGEGKDIVKKELGGIALYHDGKFIRWEIPVSAESESRINEAVKKYPGKIQIDSTVITAFDVAREWAQVNRELSGAEISDLKIDHPIDQHLKQYQRAAVEYNFRNARGVLNGDVMGLGKTLETIATLVYSQYFPALIITPASLKFTWYREFKKWTPELSVYVFNGYKNIDPELSGHSVFIINYDILGKWWNIIYPMVWKAMVCDESHYLKNPNADRTLRVEELAKGIPHKFLLSGTPILNRPEEIISQLRIIGRLNEFGGAYNFGIKYCNGHYGNFGWDTSGASNLDELNKRLRETCYIRREKKQVLKELPPKTRIPLYVKIDNGRTYESEAENLKSFIRNHPNIQKGGNDFNVMLGLYARMRKTLAIGKIKTASNWINDYFENGGKKLVVFAWHKEVIEKLKNLNPVTSTRILTGETSAIDRDRAVNDFQNLESVDLILCNIQAGGVGITLTAADTALFVELGWNPGTMEQAEDRIYRIGQENPVSVYYMLGEGTIDVKNWSRIWTDKKTITDSAVSGLEFIKEMFQ